MSLFPAYHKESANEEKDNAHVIEDSSWLQNDSCPPEIGFMPKSADKRNASEVQKNFSIIDDTTNKGLKRKEKSSHSFNSYSRDKDDCKKEKKKRASSKKTKIKSKACRMSTFDPARTYNNFEVWSNLLGKMKSVFLEECGLDITPEKAFFISTVGDSSNSSISGTPFHQRSQYKPLKSILGIEPFINSKTKQRRYFSKSIKKSYIQESCSIRPLKKYFLSTDDKYVPLNLTFEEEGKLCMEKNAEVNEKHPQTPYYDQKNTEEREFSSELEYWQWKMKSYNEKVTHSPNDVSLWLNFVQMQDKAFTYIFQDKLKSNQQNNIRAVTERKIAILDSAIEKNITSLDLKYERLQLGQEIWEIDFLHQEWNELVNNFSTDISVWQKYINFYQTYFPSFNLIQVSKAFSTCTKKLVKMSSDPLCPTGDIGRNLVDMTVHLAFVWCQIGYMERSIALMQALIELNFYCPQNLRNVSESSKIDMFEAFWDSKAPRFAEPGSVGWAKFMQKGVSVEFPELIIGGSKDEEDEILESNVAFPNMWINVESSRELYNWMPWQLDPDDCEDPDRMVNFDCLREHVFVLNNDLDKVYILTRFLEFLFPEDSLFNNGKTNFSWWKLESLQSLVLEKEYSACDTFLFPVIGPSIHKMESENYFNFLCRLINQIITLCNNEEKNNMALKLIKLYKARCRTLLRKPLDQIFIKRIRKEIKSILKKPEFRSSVELFHEYGLLEEEIGCHEDAVKIFVGAISLGIQCGNIMSAPSIPLLKCVKSLIKTQLESDKACNNQHLAVNLNVTVVTLVLQNKLVLNSTENNPFDILKAKQKLKSVIAEELLNIESKGIDNDYICYNIFLLVMVDYFANGFRSACLLMESYNKTLQMVKISKKEILYEDYLWLIDISSKLHKLIPYIPLSRKITQDILSSALQLSPNNLIFLNKIAENQSWRDLFFGSSEANPSIVSIIMRILPHIKKARQFTDNQDIGIFSIGRKIEHILKTALKSNSGKTYPLLWRLYLRVVSLVHPSALQPICYQALHSCPGAKCIYLDCIRLVPEMLKEVLLLMQEKKVRIRLPLEELEILLEKEEDIMM